MKVTDSISQYLQEKASLVNEAFLQHIELETTPKKLVEAMSYSFMAGGKRLRPALVYAANEAVRGTAEFCQPIACAIEMIHTYSLIHDDLPAMDNDDFRRGKPTNHKVFGEALAILAGDGLLTHAFHVLTNGCKQNGVPAETTLQLVEELSRYAGISGMVGGQVNDMLGENRALSVEELSAIHLRKTGDLFVCALRAGAIAGQASEPQIGALSEFGYRLGLAFQIQDDVLDVIGDETKMGKKLGSDEKLLKSTYPSLIGLEASIAEIERLMKEARDRLNDTGLQPERLLQIADFILQREG